MFPKFKAFVVLFTLFTSLPAAALEEVVYQLDWLPGGDKAPIYAGIQEGFFKDEGIKVKISPGRGSTDALTKLATGRSDIGSAGIGALLSAKAQQNIPVTGVASIFTKAPHAFLTYEGSGIDSVSTLKGKRVATSPFTSSNIYLPIVLNENGLSEESLKIMYVDPGALGPMLAAARTDAIIAWMTDKHRYEVQLAKTKRTLKVIPWSEAGMDIYGISLVASDRFIQKQPGLAKRFTKAFLRALQFVHTQPEQAAKHVNSMVPEVSIDVALSAITEFNLLSNNFIMENDGLGTFTQERLASTWAWVSKAQALAPDSLDLDSATTPVLLPGSALLPESALLPSAK